MMRTRHLAALGAGFVAAALVALPASASDDGFTAGAFTWSKTSATISVGDKVTWSNPATGGGFHNVCVAKPGDTPSGTSATDGSTCTEFRHGDAGGNPGTDWTAEHVFSTAGTYQFICQEHPTTMAGTISVSTGGGTTTTGTTGTGTGTSTTTPPDTMPTDTTTVPTQTQTGTTEATDTTAPAFTGKLKRRASRKSLILEFGSSEAGRLKAEVYRRPVKNGFFGKIGEASLKVKAGKNVVTLPRRAAGSMRKGAYRVKLRLEDPAGNKSATKTLNFKIA